MPLGALLLDLTLTLLMTGVLVQVSCGRKVFLQGKPMAPCPHMNCCFQKSDSVFLSFNQIYLLVMQSLWSVLVLCR